MNGHYYFSSDLNNP